MNRELETTFIFSTHDQDIVDIADHVIRLQDGLIVKDYKTASIPSTLTSEPSLAKVSA